MIKLNKYVYIHFTTILFFVVCYLSRKLEIFAINYFIILVHELTHLAAALFIGLIPSHIIFFPFGVNLKLKNSLVYSLINEIILYLSGPLSNVVMALCSLIFFKRWGEYAKIFYYSNIYLFIFNMLPILPMDGGIILKKCLAYFIGDRSSERILKVLSVILIIFLMLIEIYIAQKNKFNFSVLFVIIFLTANIFTNNEKYHLEFAKKLIYYQQKDKFQYKKVKTLIIKENTSYKDLIKNIAFGKNYIFFKEDNAGKIEQILTERNIIEEIICQKNKNNFK